MTTCSISMVRPPSQHEGTKWTAAGIRRARRVEGAGNRARWPRSFAPAADAATGKGLTWTEHEVTKRAQLWAPGPYEGTWWMKVWEGTADFPGEMRLADVGKDGSIYRRPEVYNAQGHKAHLADGSNCYSGSASYQPGYAHNCAGCAADHEAGLVA